MNAFIVREHVTITAFAMIKTGILNPALSSLLCRVRHTNTLVIASADFPRIEGVETIDLSLTDNIPRVADVLNAIRPNFVIGPMWTSREESHEQLVERARSAVGIVRTGDAGRHATVIIESA